MMRYIHVLTNEGYQNQIAANVIANKGFIQQFGGMYGGKLKLNPNHVSVFGGIFR
jgi:hypothetical protein